jgi:hypothetical protein
MAITFDEAHEQMTAIREGLAREVDRIRADANYSDRGRARLAAKAVVTARDKAASLREQFTSDNEARRVQLTKSLFGIAANADPATVLAARDADDRAEKLEGATEARRMLQRALDRGDSTLARAVAGKAQTVGWGDVVESYADATGLADQLDELSDLPSGAEASLGIAALFSVPAPPQVQQYAGRDDEDLRRFAEDDGGAGDHRVPLRSVGVGAPIDFNLTR